MLAVQLHVNLLVLSVLLNFGCCEGRVKARLRSAPRCWDTVVVVFASNGQHSNWFQTTLKLLCMSPSQPCQLVGMVTTVVCCLHSCWHSRGTSQLLRTTLCLQTVIHKCVCHLHAA